MGTGPADPAAYHLANFLKVVRSRKTADLTAGVEEGRKSAALCHYANIAYRVGRTLNINPATGEIQNDPEAVKLTARRFRKPYELATI